MCTVWMSLMKKAHFILIWASLSPTGDKPGVQVRKERRSELHQQAQDAALRPLLRPALPRRGGVRRPEASFQGEGRERRGLEAGLLRASRGHRCTTRVGHRRHFQRASPAIRVVRSHQAPPALPRRAQWCRGSGCF